MGQVAYRYRAQASTDEGCPQPAKAIISVNGIGLDMFAESFTSSYALGVQRPVPGIDVSEAHLRIGDNELGAFMVEQWLQSTHEAAALVLHLHGSTLL